MSELIVFSLHLEREGGREYLADPGKSGKRKTVYDLRMSIKPRQRQIKDRFELRRQGYAAAE